MLEVGLILGPQYRVLKTRINSKLFRCSYGVAKLINFWISEYAMVKGMQTSNFLITYCKNKSTPQPPPPPPRLLLYQPAETLRF